MATPIGFDEYLANLGRLSAHIDPTASSPEAEEIKAAVESLSALPTITEETIAGWVALHPAEVPVLGLIVGLSRERLKNVLREAFGTSGWVSLARTRTTYLVQWLDREFDLVRMLRVQLSRQYDLGDVLVARAGTRATATRAGQSGRRVEDLIEAIAHDLGLTCETRTRFVGRGTTDGPCDLVVPSAAEAQIVVAAKAFDSTGSKLTDAYREIQEMASIRKPSQFVMAVVDGIGWLSRIADLRKIHKLWADGEIDGLYTLGTLDQFRDDLEEAARLRGLLNS